MNGGVLVSKGLEYIILLHLFQMFCHFFFLSEALNSLYA